MSEPIHRNALPPGYALHWYRVDTILGQGGFGITYLAEDGNLHQRVAIKEFLPVELAVRDQDDSVQPVSGAQGEQFAWGLGRFVSEARTLARFDHPNIVRVLAVFEANNTAYIVMRYEQGRTLHEILKPRTTLEETEVRALLGPLLDGLEAVHGAGFIHRDIKPGNVFVRDDGSPLLIDFGSARQSLSGEARTLTALISPGYAPYEQYFSSSDEQGPWTDIYGLAATIYRAIAGAAPTEAVDRSKSVLEGTGDGHTPAVEIGRGRYGPKFLAAIDHALRFRRQDRPQSVAEWRRELGFEGPAGATAAPLPRAADPGTDFAEAPTAVAGKEAQEAPTEEADVAFPSTRALADGPSPASAIPAPRSGRGALIGLTSVVALTAVAGIWLLRPQSEPGPQTRPAASAPTAPRSTETSLPTAPDPAPPAATVEPAAVPVTTLLAQARSHESAGRLTRPAGRNAFERYRDVLLREPENEEARQSIRGIVERHVRLALEASARRDYDTAQGLLDRLTEVMPDSPTLARVSGRIQTQRERAARR
jgi:serine/threonine protein kinase